MTEETVVAIAILAICISVAIAAAIVTRNIVLELRAHRRHWRDDIHASLPNYIKPFSIGMGIKTPFGTANVTVYSDGRREYTLAKDMKSRPLPLWFGVACPYVAWRLLVFN